MTEPSGYRKLALVPPDPIIPVPSEAEKMRALAMQEFDAILAKLLEDIGWAAKWGCLALERVLKAQRFRPLIVQALRDKGFKVKTHWFSKRLTIRW